MSTQKKKEIAIIRKLIMILITSKTKNRFYATILGKIAKQETKTLPTAAVGWTPNGKMVLLYNDKFLNAQTDEDGIFVILHEVLHVFFRHLFRFKMGDMTPQDRQLDNIYM